MRTSAGVVPVLLLALAAADAPAQSAAPASHGLREIVDREAARSSKALRDRILGMLRDWALKHDLAADRGKAQIDTIVGYGPDAVPLLIGLVKAASGGEGERAVVQPAARALVGLTGTTRNFSLLRDLTEAAKPAPAAIRVDVLAALEQLDHPIVLDFAAPLLDDENPGVRAAAVRAVGHQKSNAEHAAKLLRPQLTKPNGPWVEALDALRELGDRQSIDLAQTALTGGGDPAYLAAALRFVDRFGGKATLNPLEALLDPNRQSGVDDALLKQAVDAVQKIGLREIDAASRAQEILVACMNKHAMVGVRDRATWQLGPFRNEGALKKLEDPVMKDIVANKRANRPNTDRYIELAEYRLRFEQWSKANESLSNAREEDEKGLRTTYIETLRAVANCGLDKLPAAKRTLDTLRAEERADLIQKYPILEKMARDPKYKDLFPSR